MVYGDGFPAADDVVGHELTHGVTSFESNLFYYYQSGAINESFSDLWGEFMDLGNGAGTDTPAVRWQMGEDVPGFGAIRNMQDPTLFGDPDKMSSLNYYEGSGDNGGVHFNSGVNNKAVFLMTDGGAFNGQTIAAMGIPKVAKIYYEVQTNLLASGADYNDMFEALFQGCTNLVGTSGITAGDCTNVRNATLAVEMNLQPAPNFHPEAPICGAGDAPNHLFSANMEVPGAFLFAATVGSNRWGHVTGYAHGGVTSLYGADSPAATTDTTATMASGVVLPANAFMHFSHAFGFEGPNFDGGVIEYSINNGVNWTDAGSLIEANGYNGVISNLDTNPLVGRSAFVSESHGYMSNRLNLASLAGQTVKFRFRMGLDSTIPFFGWVVDDVRIYTCVGGATRIINLTGSLAFGERHVGSSSTTTLTIGNSGNSALTVTSITYPAGFSGAFSGSVPAGGSQNVTVTFAPTAMTSYGGTVTVNANQTSGTPTTSASGVGSVDSTRNGDFDGDGKTEITIYRPSEGRWYMLRSGSGFTPGPSYNFGVSTDVPVPGDYDGDGKTDIAVLRPSTGHWFILTSTSNYTSYVAYQFGVSGDQPVPGDYDNDNKTDIAIYRPSNGLWFILSSSSNFTTYSVFNWGTTGDVPAPADWDGDGDFDIAVYRAPGFWFIRNIGVIQWGTSGDVPVPGDFTGDRITDAAVYRPSTGQWFIRNTNGGAMSVYQWGGAAGDLPVVGDFDADGRADVTIFRNSGHWFVLKSGSNYTTFNTYQWGVSTDVILPRRP